MSEPKPRKLDDEVTLVTVGIIDKKRFKRLKKRNKIANKWFNNLPDIEVVNIKKCVKKLNSHRCSVELGNKFFFENDTKLKKLLFNQRKMNPGCTYCKNVECLNKIKFKWCSRCHVVAYCGKECQRKDWNTHKKYCLKITTATEVAFPELGLICLRCKKKFF